MKINTANTNTAYKNVKEAVFEYISFVKLFYSFKEHPENIVDFILEHMEESDNMYNTFKDIKLGLTGEYSRERALELAASNALLFLKTKLDAVMNVVAELNNNVQNDKDLLNGYKETLLAPIDTQSMLEKMTMLGTNPLKKEYFLGKLEAIIDAKELGAITKLLDKVNDVNNIIVSNDVKSTLNSIGGEVQEYLSRSEDNDDNLIKIVLSNIKDYQSDDDKVSQNVIDQAIINVFDNVPEDAIKNSTTDTQYSYALLGYTSSRPGDKIAIDENSVTDTLIKLNSGIINIINSIDAIENYDVNVYIGNILQLTYRDTEAYLNGNMELENFMFRIDSYTTIMNYVFSRLDVISKTCSDQIDTIVSDIYIVLGVNDLFKNLLDKVTNI